MAHFVAMNNIPYQQGGNSHLSPMIDRYQLIKDSV